MAALIACAIGAVVIGTRRAPPDADVLTVAALTAQLPPAKQLMPHLWAGPVTRGDARSAGLPQQSALLGALLLDLDLAVAADDEAQAQRLLRQLANVVEAAGLLEPDVQRLRGWSAAADALTRLRSDQLERRRLEDRLRRRFLPVNVSLGAFAEASRLAALAADDRLETDPGISRYLRTVLDSDDETLDATARQAIATLLRAGQEPSARQQASEDLLAALAR